MGSINELGLIDRLFSIVNNSQDANDPDNVLADYFLTHYAQLNAINVWDIADACFVSRSSVRRFCQRIGFDNYRQLKDEMRRYNHSYEYFMREATQDNYKDRFSEELIAMAREMNERCDITEMDHICSRIHDAERVLLLTSYSSFSCVHEFQRPLVLSGKVCRLMSDIAIDDDYLRRMQDTDYLVVCSAMGTYARTIKPIISNCAAEKVLITASRSEDLKDGFDRVYHLSARDYNGVKSWYGKYGMFYFFDVLYSEYVRQYGTEFQKNVPKDPD